MGKTGTLLCIIFQTTNMPLAKPIYFKNVFIFLCNKVYYSVGEAGQVCSVR